MVIFSSYFFTMFKRKENTMLENLMKFKYEAKCSLSVSSENHSVQTLLGCCTADRSVKSLRLRRPTGCLGIHLSAGRAGTLSQRLGRLPNCQSLERDAKGGPTDCSQERDFSRSFIILIRELGQALVSHATDFLFVLF